MKVFIITKQAFPHGMAAAKRISCYAKGLISAGIDCEVIIATRTEIYGKQPKNIIAKAGFFTYISNKTQRESNVLIRRLNDYKDTIMTLRYIIKNSTNKDVILNYLREDSLNSLIIKAAKKTGAKVVRDLCEFPYGTGEETVKIKSKRNSFLKNIFPKFDGFICISEPLLDLANKYKSPDAKVIKVPILIEPKESETEELIFSPIKTPYIFHSGTLYEQKDGILGAIEAFAIASTRLSFPVKYVLTGNLSKSPNKVDIEKLIEKYCIQDKIIFTGFLETSDLIAYQKSCTMMIINKLDNQQNKYCFATKLGDYLLAEKPVITTDIGESTNYLKDGESAYIVESGNIAILAKKIEDVFTDTVNNKIIAENGKKVALTYFSYNTQGSRLADFLKNL
ncbi:glycosyltransferase family 4 protein [uncultured Maribacter sp.]|uniref:glycosyltransferase family 4 protein n=1 Tax=uncultured Maribacter sp. TaxID=431308 RepID=UPI00262C53CF|nr:glycosyltransferase [uncultured Maribacter sp.]